MHKIKTFGINFDPIGYNYWDYVDAWYYVFWDQNKFYKHTWFIYFKTKTKYDFPQWFRHWWDFFGPLPEMFPPTVVQAFEFFKQKFNLEGKPFPVNFTIFQTYLSHGFSPGVTDSQTLKDPDTCLYYKDFRQ